MTIQYPIARGQDGSAVHIDTWVRGQVVTCFGCGQDLIGRMPHDGIKPTAHFAHKADAECNGETTLHKAAKAAIVKAHARGSLRSLAWDCPCCQRCQHQTDLSALVLCKEARPCPGVVSDVLGCDKDVPRVAIEIVVTHDIEAATLERYRAQDLRVFVLRPNWGIVGDIVGGVDPLIVEHRVGSVDPESCVGCQQVLREKHEWEERARAGRAMAWWNVWITAWRNIGIEPNRQAEDQLRASQRQRAADLRADTWWLSWQHVWKRIAAQIVDLWWVEWRQSWREIGTQHARPHLWMRTWKLVWSEIGKQYAKDVVARARQQAEAEARERERYRQWWPAWIKVWEDIGLRSSGMMAAWKPICRQCRQDLKADHRCFS